MLTGTLPVSRELKSHITKFADESFTANLSIAIEDLPPAPEGWTIDMDTMIGVKMRGYCDPHTDDYQGRGDVAKHRSLFWLISDTSKRTSKLIADGDFVRMNVGDWAVFDDAKMHAFLAEGTWVGVAVQMTPTKKNSKR